MKALIALVGEKGGGKETFGNIVIELAQKENKTVTRCRFSDILNETLKLWNIETTRPKLQILSQAMDNAYGKGTLTKAVKSRFENNPADIVIADGVRWETDRQMIRSIFRNVLVYITADSKIRYQRCVSRGRVEEGKKTLEDFMKEELAETEKYIPEIGARADFIIQNNGSEAELRKKVEEFYRSFIEKFYPPNPV